jgi:hypothetical protein
MIVMENEMTASIPESVAIEPIDLPIQPIPILLTLQSAQCITGTTSSSEKA